MKILGAYVLTILFAAASFGCVMYGKPDAAFGFGFLAFMGVVVIYEKI